tara:strand:- start:951 stop:1253 length:303 start_codon:yes stop_codon:yes gene_type:complete
MGFKTTLKEKRDKALSKYQHFQSKVKSNLKKWRRESKQRKSVETFCNKQVLSSTMQGLGQRVWLPGGSKLVKLMILEGKIVEKVYLTMDGVSFTRKGNSL